MSVLTTSEVLSLVPQQRPMRFIDDIIEIDEEHILGTYAWKEEDCRGYSPEGVSVPLFKLIEMAAQIGNVAWCIYQMTLNSPPDDIRRLVGVLTKVERAELKAPVRAGDKVACMASFNSEGYFRGNKLVSDVEMQIQGGPRDGLEVFSGVIAGLWVPKDYKSLR